MVLRERFRNRLHRIESDLAYASAGQYRSPGGEAMFLTHDEWTTTLKSSGLFRQVRLEPLDSISKYGHHTLIEATL